MEQTVEFYHNVIEYFKTNYLNYAFILLFFIAGFVITNFMFWVDTFKTTNRSLHHSIRSKVMDDVVLALIAKGFSLPATVIPIKNFEPNTPLSQKVETNEIGIIKP